MCKQKRLNTAGLDYHLIMPIKDCMRKQICENDEAVQQTRLAWLAKY
jgi:hypothetical protein